MTSIKEEDNAHLIECKAEVEAAYEKGKWDQVAKAMEAKGTELYPPEVLQRQYKKLMGKAENLLKGKSWDAKNDEGGDVENDEE